VANHRALLLRRFRTEESFRKPRELSCCSQGVFDATNLSGRADALRILAAALAARSIGSSRRRRSGIPARLRRHWNASRIRTIRHCFVRRMTRITAA
jgi:hypothetical protein